MSLYTQSEAAFNNAIQVMPGGVSSPVRAYKSVGQTPITIASASGSHVTDIDGREYVDYVGSYGPMIVGHTEPSVVEAVSQAAAKGASFGMPSQGETTLAQMVVDAVPCIEKVRFVNSGTEATMSAIRVARGVTQRDKMIKCVGGYHGHADGLLVQAGSGATTLGVPSSPGVPAGTTQDTLLMPYNDIEAAKALFNEYADQIACVIIEPVAGNMGCIPPSEGYLQALRDLCTANGTILIFDEVMTGFRVHYGSAQSLYGITPDMSCMGKVIGGGLPCAAYGGSAKIMSQVAPEGPIYQAGTLSGNPLAMASGIATLNILKQPGQYEKLEAASAQLQAGLTDAASAASCPIKMNRVGSMLTVFFTDKPVTNYDDATACDTDRFAKFFKAMLDEGIVLPPSQFEAWFVGLAHDEQAIEKTIAAARKAFKAVV